MKLAQKIVMGLVTGLLCSVLQGQTSLPPASEADVAFNLKADRPGKLDFFGSKAADLFTKEVNESFKGALQRDYVSAQDGKFALGFLNASPPPQPWAGTMWTRDGGTFMRELVFWGYYEHACQVAQCLMDFAGTNQEGFIAFPEYFSPADVHKTGTEIDGQGAIIIAMVSLWQRLPPDDPFRRRLYDFLHQKSSPVRYLHHQLEHHPLIAGAGEFGGGAGVTGLYYNVVQNNLSALALLSAAELEKEAGDRATARLWRKDANTIFRNMEKYLVDKAGSWIWCIDPKTLKPDPAVMRNPVNVGFGGLNGVACMSADVLGFEPSDWRWHGLVVHGEDTFQKLYAFPLRKEQFKKYGFWSQFDVFRDGLNSSPSYGQGYALQTMLLFNKLDMAGHALDFLADATFDPKGVSFSYGEIHYGRLSPYYFYERIYSPDAQNNKKELTAGCGPLNLVNVTEPLKVARLILGVDDTSLQEVRIVPRLPPSWSGYRAENWPIRASHGVVRADLSFKRKDGSVTFSLRVRQGRTIPKLAVRLPVKNNTIWKRQSNVKEIKLESTIRP
jgi:hypothetical protein